MASVYISYAHRDRAKVLDLVTRLEARGIDCVWDQDILPGEKWEEEIRRLNSNANAVIFVWSAAALESEILLVEAHYAHADKKLIQIRLDDAVPPTPFASIAWVDYDDVATADAAIDRILRGLAQLGVEADERQISVERDSSRAKNRGFAFVSHVEEDVGALREVSKFLTGRRYAYWSYHESDRDYQKPTVLEIEERMLESVVILTVLSPDWKRSEWTQRELAFAREIRKPLFHLRFRNPGPTLAIAGDTFFDIETNKDDGFRRLGVELDKKGL